MKTKLNCLVVDDEQLARELIVNYLTPQPAIEQISICKDCSEAQAIIEKESIDLVFMDIEMPGVRGIDFMRSVQRPVKVIFTTAYRQFAVESYDLNAVDYLLKPIGEHRFQLAFDKALQQIEQERQIAQIQVEAANLTVKVGHNLRRIALPEVRYIKALREYVQFYLDKERVTSLMSMSELEESLPASQFLRIHRSFLVAKEQVVMQLGNKLILQDGTELPIGRTYKKAGLQALFE